MNSQRGNMCLWWHARSVMDRAGAAEAPALCTEEGAVDGDFGAGAHLASSSVSINALAQPLPRTPSPKLLVGPSGSKSGFLLRKFIPLGGKLWEGGGGVGVVL